MLDEESFMDACVAAFDLGCATIDRISSRRSYWKDNGRIIAWVFNCLKRNAFHDRQSVGYVAHAQSKKEEIKAAAFSPSPPPSRPRSPPSDPARAPAAPPSPPAAPRRATGNADGDVSDSPSSSSSFSSGMASRPRRPTLRRAAGRQPREESEESHAASDSSSSSPSRPVRPIPDAATPARNRTTGRPPRARP